KSTALPTELTTLFELATFSVATAGNNTDLMLLCNVFFQKNIQTLKKQSVNPENVTFTLRGQ
ncbi:hypothetical protein, partial [Proteus mirabilis]|uniref:hypothetical protein n=2 Tax=Proteus mirabilis TaxID=584 RepID=UPI0006694337